MANLHWTCPYCDRNATLVDTNISIANHWFNNGNKDGGLALRSTVHVCPNDKCKEYEIFATLYKTVATSGGGTRLDEVLTGWQLKPDSSAKPLPAYIPDPLVEDYKEAASIVTKSPKASATLSRRCLQGMIRDFWKISKPRLVDEIDELEDRIDPDTWAAIDAVRRVGNIGAHMEKDINLVIDVEPDEAKLLLGLLETLFEDWYIDRYKRQERKRQVIELAEAKKPKATESKPSPSA